MLNRRGFLAAALAGAGMSVLPQWLQAQAGQADPGGAARPRGRRKNVLFIPVDDLRPQLGCYGHSEIISPNIDRLAQRGMVFERAYCQQAVCGPSRASLLTGLRPDTTRIYDLKTHFRQNLPDAVTLPQHFKNSGYHSEMMGKIFHSGLEDEPSCSVPHRYPKGREYLLQPRPTTRAATNPESIADRGIRGPATEAADVPDNAYRSGQLTDMAVESLRRLAPKSKETPFFLSVGYTKPHLPFCAPKRYWDLYDRSKLKLPVQERPKGAPDVAFTDWPELRAYSDIPAKGLLDEAKTRELIHGYYACVSYTDAQVGRLLDELDRLGLASDTVVVLWGDHGWKLGEYSAWCKHTNFEIDTHSPLIIADPDRRVGQRTRALTEFVDVYPTLAEMCGLPLPAGLEGTSAVPLFEQPDRKWKSAAFSQYPRPQKIDAPNRVMGRSVRTDRYRYTQWTLDKTGEVQHRELYDVASDPLTMTNIAADQPQLAAQLEGILKAGWQAARP